MNASDRDLTAAGLSSPALQPALHGAAVAPVGLDIDDDASQHRLPSDHPRWNRDTITLSQRARAIFARLAPVAVKVIHFWEHRVRSIVIGNRTLSVDASGSYRLR